MSEISFKWTVVEVHPEFQAMAIKYTRTGYKEYLIGTPLPSTDFPLEELAKTYAPIVQWQQEDREIVVPSVGITGDVVIPLSSDVTQTNTANNITEQSFEPNPFIDDSSANTVIN